MTRLGNFLLLLLLTVNANALNEKTEDGSGKEWASQRNELDNDKNNAHTVIDTLPLDALDHVDWILEMNDTINVKCPVADKVLVTINKNPIAVYERTESGFHKRVINEDFARVINFDGTEPAPRVVVQMMSSGVMRCFDFKTANNTESTVILYDNISGRQFLTVGNERHFVEDKTTAILNGRESVNLEFTVTSLLGREPSCSSNVTAESEKVTSPLEYERITRKDHYTTYEAPLWKENNSPLMIVTTCCDEMYGNRFCMQFSIQTSDRVTYIPALDQDYASYPQAEDGIEGEKGLLFSPRTRNPDRQDNNTCPHFSGNETSNTSHNTQNTCLADKGYDTENSLKADTVYSFEMDEINVVLIAIAIGLENLVLMGIVVFTTCRCLQAQRRLKEISQEKEA